MALYIPDTPDTHGKAHTHTHAYTQTHFQTHTNNTLRHTYTQIQVPTQCMLTYLSTVYSDDQCHWSVSRDKKVYKILSQSKEFGFIILSGFLSIESCYVF